MSHDYTLPTSFENLPTEIFLQIFGFLSLQELVTAFSGLNNYIDSIIRSARGASHVVKHGEADFISLVHLFSTQINRLTIVHAAALNITSLINLRSLTLKYGTRTQFDSIRPQHFAMLEILHIYAGRHINMDGNTQATRDLFQVILSNGFTQLRVCTADRIGLLESSETWLGSPSLRSLHLDMKTAYDYEQLLSVCPNLRRFTSSSPLWINLGADTNRFDLGYRSISRRLKTEIKNLKQLESEGIFILNVNPIALLNSAEPPPRFNNTTITQNFYTKNLNIIQGRILPRSDPYCRASFLVEIRLPPEYPFKMPELIFLDPIYHPSVERSGRHCCCWHLGDNGRWGPTTPLIDLIRAVIAVIDSGLDLMHTTQFELAQEYQNDRETFNKKALRSTLSNGRPRY